MRQLSLAIVIGLACLPAAAQSPAPAPLEKPSAADLENGGKLFVTYCSRCHGFDGTGGMGPPLARPKLRHASDEAGIIAILENGIPGSAMMAAWAMSEREIAQVAAYVRTLGRRPVEALPGDPGRGEVAYGRLGCAGCHILDGAGTGIGPDLSDVGVQRGSAFLRQSVLDPGAAHPERPVPYEPYAYPAYVVVRARPRVGPEVRACASTKTRSPSSSATRRDVSIPSAKRICNVWRPRPTTSLMPSYRGMLRDVGAERSRRLPDDTGARTMTVRRLLPLALLALLGPAAAGAEAPYARVRAGRASPGRGSPTRARTMGIASRPSPRSRRPTSPGSGPSGSIRCRSRDRSSPPLSSPTG